MLFVEPSLWIVFERGPRRRRLAFFMLKEMTASKKILAKVRKGIQIRSKTIVFERPQVAITAERQTSFTLRKAAGRASVWRGDSCLTCRQVKVDRDYRQRESILWVVS